MSYLRFEDQADGVHVFFDDVTDPGPIGTESTFNERDIATLKALPEEDRRALLRPQRRVYADHQARPPVR